MSTTLDLVPESIPGLGFGGVAGLIVGYAAKKLTALAAVLLAMLFVLLQVLAHMGFVTVDWGAIQSSTEHAWQTPEALGLADRVWALLVANLPFASAFAGGFALGFKLG